MEDLKNVEFSLNECISTQNILVLRKLRKLLWNTLQSLDHSLESYEEKTRNSRHRCPKCQSSNVKNHGTDPAIRIYCVDCSKAYTINRQPLYYRKRNRITIIDLIVQIHTTDKTTTEIIDHLKISSRTYYLWRKEIISVFPQLEPKFKKRRKNSLG